MQIHCRSTTTQLPEIFTQIVKCLLSQSMVIWNIVCLYTCRLFVHSYLFIHSFSRTWPEVDPTSRPSLSICQLFVHSHLFICSSPRAWPRVDPAPSNHQPRSAEARASLIHPQSSPPHWHLQQVEPQHHLLPRLVATQQILIARVEARLITPASILTFNTSSLNTSFYQDLLQPSRSW